MKASVSEKGQITIPKRLRDRLGIRPGQVLDFSENRGRLVAVKTGMRGRTSIDERLDRVSGILKTRESTDEIMSRLRGDRSDL